MLASSGNELKLWNLETQELVEEYSFANKSKAVTPLSCFAIKSDGLCKIGLSL
jgi:hypothetical protein